MLLASIGWSATLLAACGSSTITGSGRITSTPVPVSSFTRIQVADAFSVVLKRGQTDQVVVRVDDNLVDELDVGVSNGTLRLALKPNLSIQRATLQANVTVKDLAGVELSGASSVLVSDLVTAQRLTVAMSGASQFRGNIMAKQADLRL